MGVSAEIHEDPLLLLCPREQESIILHFNTPQMPQGNIRAPLRNLTQWMTPPNKNTRGKNKEAGQTAHLFQDHLVRSPLGIAGALACQDATAAELSGRLASPGGKRDGFVSPFVWSPVDSIKEG